MKSCTTPIISSIVQLSTFVPSSAPNTLLALLIGILTPLTVHIGGEQVGVVADIHDILYQVVLLLLSELLMSLILTVVYHVCVYALVYKYSSLVY